MFRYLPVFAAFAVNLLSSAFIPSLNADGPDNTTAASSSGSQEGAAPKNELAFGLGGIPSTPRNTIRDRLDLGPGTALASQLWPPVRLRQARCRLRRD